MDPIIGPIVAALVAGATAAAKGLATDTIKDAYQGLKNLVKNRLGTRAEVVDRVDREPSDSVEHDALALYLKSSDLGSDEEIKEAVRKLFAALEELRGRPEAEAVFDLGRLTGKNVELSDSEFSETFFRAKEVELEGDFKARGIRRAGEGGTTEKKP